MWEAAGGTELIVVPTKNSTYIITNSEINKSYGNSPLKILRPSILFFRMAVLVSILTNIFTEVPFSLCLG